MRTLNLNNVEEATGVFNSPKEGGYVCIITDVEDVADREYLKISYDIADGEFKGYYTNLSKEKGWNMPAFIKSYKENALPFFKGFVTSVEKTNKGFKWDGTDEKAFIKKGVGLVLQEELYTNQKGEEKKRLRVDTIHSTEAIRKGDFKVPEVKDSTNKITPQVTNSPFSNGVNEEPKEESSFFSEPTDDACPF